MMNTPLSKRNLKWFVDNGHVENWFDYRFPTVRGILRSGLCLSALTDFMLEIGPSKNTNLMSWDKIWTKNKKVRDPKATRFIAISADKTCTITVSDFGTDVVVK